MRASFYMLGPFMARFNKAIVSLPGGCAWGPRPVDFHIKALKKMGAEINLKDGNIISKGQLKGAHIKFHKKSVGATGNIIMAAVGAHGKTKISNAACEPEIEDLCNFLLSLGVEIEGVGTNSLTIRPPKKTKNKITYSVIPDRIEAATFMILALMTKGRITLDNININHLEIIIDKLNSVGAKINILNKNRITVQYNNIIKSVNVETTEYPGFPTDIQAQWMALMSISKDNSSIEENIYKDRFTHVSELNRFGAKINVKNNVAFIEGVNNLVPAPVMSTDIRASASLILAALNAKGKSSISRIYHIDRGYENIENKIQKLGGNIKRVKS